MLKYCPGCGLNKSLKEMGKQGRYCLLCSRRISKAWKQNNPEKYKISQRKQDLKKRLHITIEDYNALFVKQEGKCAGCKRHQSEFTRNLAVDHCHITGLIRGLLCNMCNLALGKVDDNSNTLRVLADYLDAPKPELAGNNSNVVELRLAKKVRIAI